MTRALFIVLCVAALGCQLPSSSKVLYRCEDTHTCSRAGFTCWSDGYCHPDTDGADPDGGTAGGAGGGTAGGGGGGGGGGIAGGGGGGTAGGGGGGLGGGGGGGGCVPATACPVSAACGFFDAGCGVDLDCGACVAPEECGLAAPNTCSLPNLCAQGFCWENPLPQGNTLRAAWAWSARSVWAVGDTGTVLFWNGEHSQLVDVGTLANLYDVHGSAPDDVYAVGDNGVVLRFNGASWAREPTPGIYRINVVWAAGNGLAFAGANGGYILKRDAALGTWSEMSFTGVSSTADILGLHGLASGEVYATSLTRVFRLPSRTASNWVGDTSWAGTNRDTITLGGTPTQLFVGGKMSGQAFGVLQARVSDGGWEQFGANVPLGLDTIAALRDDEPWVSGDGGQITVLHADGGSTRYLHARGGQLTGLALLDEGSAFFSGTSGSMGLVVDSGVRDLSSGGTTALNAVCGFADARMYGPADSRLVYERRSNALGVRWDPVQRTAGNTNRWLACLAQGPDQVWVLGDDRYFLAQQLGVFQQADLNTNANWVGVWGPPGRGPWTFVADNRKVLESADGGSPPTTSQDATQAPAGIWGLSYATDMYIVGAGSMLRQHLSTYWQDVVPPGGQYGKALKGIHASTLTDGGSLYSVVGADAAWRRVNGTWVADTIPAGNTLRTTWVLPSGDIWAAGDNGAASPVGVLWRLPGAADGGWGMWPVPARVPFSGLTAVNTNLFLVGQGGVILRQAGADGG